MNHHQWRRSNSGNTINNTLHNNIALIGYAVGVVVASFIKRILPKLVKQASLGPDVTSIITGSIETFIIFIALAIVFSVGS